MRGVLTGVAVFFGVICVISEISVRARCTCPQSGAIEFSGSLSHGHIRDDPSQLLMPLAANISGAKLLTANTSVSDIPFLHPASKLPSADMIFPRGGVPPALHHTFERMWQTWNLTDEDQLSYIDAPVAAVYVLHDAISVGYGVLLLNENGCRAFYNRGCGGTDSKFHIPPTACASIPSYERVISLALKWGHGTWHFPMEVLSGVSQWDPVVRALPDEFPPRAEAFEGTVLHVGFVLSRFHEELLGVLDIPLKNVVSGPVHGEIVYVPRAGRCGVPSMWHIYWMRTKFSAKLGLDLEGGKQKKIVLIRRRDPGRSVVNHNDVETAVRRFAEDRGARLFIHDDLRLGDVPEQAQIFSGADLIVGPHGAGMFWTFLAKPGGALVEMFPPDRLAVRPACYAQLARSLHMTYRALFLDQASRANITLLEDVLYKVEF